MKLCKKLINNTFLWDKSHNLAEAGKTMRRVIEPASFYG